MLANGFQDLLRRAQNGDEDAMNQLLQDVRPYVERLATEYADPNDAGESVSDIVQQAQLRAWQRLAQFQGGTGEEETRGKFSVWLGKLVRSVGLNLIEARNALKRKSPDRSLVRLDASPPADSEAARPDPAASGSTPSAGFRREEEARLVQEALDRVPDPLAREAVRLCFFEGLSLRQTAERLGLTYDQVRERYHAALAKMGRDLKRAL